MRYSVGQIIFLCLLILPSFAQIKLNEICATNGDINYDPQFFNFSDWIELRNTSGSVANIGGYFLSDEKNNPLKWRVPNNITIPGNGFLLIWCDEMNTGLHTSFSLNADGETIILSDASGFQIESVSYPTQYNNMSYSKLNQENGWRISVKPSPGTVNNDGPTGIRLDPPTFSKKSGRYQGTMSTQLSHNVSGAEIRYTWDGSEPTMNSLKYSTSIVISNSMVLKAVAFHPNYLASETVSQTYLINEHSSSLPIVSIETSPEYLWDDQIGIYTSGTNGAFGGCSQAPVNWNQEWYRHASFEYLSPNGSSLIGQSVDIRIGGNCTRNFPQKSLVIKAKKKYGSNEIDYPFFSAKKFIKKVGGLFLRNAGNDFNTLMFRDAFFQSLGAGNMDIDYMAHQPVIVYLNGMYWGIQNLREKIDGDFIESNYGIDKDDIDLLETYENAIEGDSFAWQVYKNTLQSMNPNDPNTFNFIDSHIDVQEYINYLVTQIYICNTDWPGNNVKFWRQRSNNGKFRWILWDTDFGFGLYSNQSYATHPTLNFATDPNQTNWPNPAFSTLHIRLVLANPEFRNRFISTFTTAMGSTFHPDKINKMADQFASKIEDEVPYHKTRWWGNIDDWNYELQRFQDFSLARYTFMQNHLAGFFGLGNQVQFTVNISPQGAGKVNLNNVLVESISNGPYYKNVPYNAEAIPNAGFRFAGWTITSTENEFINIAPTGSIWKYYDQGQLPATNWFSSSFDDSSWPEGTGQLGYGDGDEATLLGFGPDSNNKFVTSYFRKSFTIADLTNLNDINVSILFDDGAVVYLNDVEVFRNNLPSGAIDYNTFAQQAIPENSPVSFTINKNLLVTGMNTLAVEVHQVSPTSSDISFDLTASTSRTGNTITYESNGSQISDTVYSNVTITAHFEPIPAVAGLVLNEFSVSKSFVTDNEGEAEDWIELFNSGTQPIDLTGALITDDSSIKDKHALANNEQPWLLNPGEYQILWADDQAEQGRDHLSFKLSNDGEYLGVYQVFGFDTVIVASVDFGPQLPGFSRARIPNGTGNFVLTSILTPGTENMLNEMDVSIYPNPVNNELKLILPIEPVKVGIYSLYGSLLNEVMTDSIQEVDIDTSSYANGIYFVRLSSANLNLIKRIIIFHN